MALDREKSRCRDLAGKKKTVKTSGNNFIKVNSWSILNLPARHPVCSSYFPQVLYHLNPNPTLPKPILSILSKISRGEVDGKTS